MNEEATYQPVLARANRLELLTRTECDEILKTVLADQNQIGYLSHFEIVPAVEAVGFLGEYYNLILKYRLENETDERTLRLFAKTVAYENANKTLYEEKASILRKEGNTYQMLINEFQKFSEHIWCVKCYFKRDDVLVMQHIEDMGYAPLSTGFLSEEQLRPMLKALATLHASSVAYERSKHLTIGVEFRKLLDEKSIAPDIDWWTTGVKAALAVVATHPQVLNDATAQEYIANKLPRCLDRVYYMMNPSPVHRNVFQHRDAWGGNVLYHVARPFEMSCILVDFQLCRYGPPVVDFIMASYLNVKPKERKEMMQRVADYYHENLVSVLNDMGIDAAKEQLSRAEFMQSLKEFALLGATLNCILATILRLPDNYLKTLKDQQPSEFHRFCNVTRTESVLKLMKENEEFRNYMHTCAMDLLELTYYKENEIKI